jgi:cell division protein FtsZ
MREMGKAMMGTGEASGEKRALAAAEAAISNPLIDDSTMKGARGLLISITGGKDLGLYEVDEAATRIREEVDGDANIIVGATFDESLEGIVRVSVVATGIDIVAMEHQPTHRRSPTTVAAPAPQAVAAASRLAELSQTLRANTQRVAERPERTDQAHRAVAQALAVAPAETAASAPAAEASIEDVTIRPIAPPKPTLFMEPADPVPEAAPALAEPEKPFIPPQAERPALRPPRMPRIDELPIPAQNQIRAREAETAEPAPQKQRVSLLQRLASVGLGRREEEEPRPEARPATRPVPVAAERAAPPMPKAPPMPPLQRAPEVRSESVSEYAKRPAAPRPAPQGLDQHGRQAPVNSSLEDDQLEIPAFLRRQAH